MAAKLGTAEHFISIHRHNIITKPAWQSNSKMLPCHLADISLLCQNSSIANLSVRDQADMSARLEANACVPAAGPSLPARIDTVSICYRPKHAATGAERSQILAYFCSSAAQTYACHPHAIYISARALALSAKKSTVNLASHSTDSATNTHKQTCTHLHLADLHADLQVRPCV